MIPLSPMNSAVTRSGRPRAAPIAAPSPPPTDPNSCMYSSASGDSGCTRRTTCDTKRPPSVTTRAVRRQQRIEPAAQRARVEQPRGRLVLERIRARPPERRGDLGHVPHGGRHAIPRAHAREQRLGHGARVARDRRAHAPVAAERRGVAVDLDDVRVRHQGLLVRREAVEPGTDGQDDVARVHRLLHGRPREAADQPQVGRMPAEQAAGGQRRPEHRTELVGQRTQRVGRARAERPAPREHERALRVAEALGGGVQLGRIGFGDGRRLGRDDRRIARLRDLVLVGHDDGDRRELARGRRERLVHVARGGRRLGTDDRHVGSREEGLVRDGLHARERVLGRADP